MQIGPTVWEEIGDDGQTYGRTYVRTDIIGALYTPTHKIRELIEIYTFPVCFAHRGLSRCAILEIVVVKMAYPCEPQLTDSITRFYKQFL